MIDAVKPAAMTNLICIADAMQQHSPPFVPRAIPCINPRYSEMNSEESPVRAEEHSGGASEIPRFAQWMQD